MEPKISRFDNYTPILVFILLCVLITQAVSSMSIKSPTYDEPYHLTSGYLSLAKQNYRYGADHPPLIKSFAALPLLFLDLRLPKNYSKLMEQPWPVLGKQFLFQPQNNVDQIVFLSRIPIVFLSSLLGFYVFLWAKKLYGDKAGVLALILYVFSPNILAQSRLVTTDLGVTCFMFIACYYFWAYMKDASFRTLCLAGLFSGLALVSKFSALILFPIFFLAACTWLLTTYTPLRQDRPNCREECKPARTARTFCLHASIFSTIILGVIFVVYGMDLDFIDHYNAGLDRLQKMYFENEGPRLYYLMGTFFTEPAWFYPIVVFLVKTPVPILILLVWSAMLRRRAGVNLFNESCLLIPVALIAISSFSDPEHTGIRRILPIYPFLFVLIARVVMATEKLNSSVFKKKASSYVLAILVTWCLVTSIKNYPDYLTYFNEVAGGPKNGIHYLDNANLDWGQDLKRLKPFMDQQGIEKIKLMYEGQADSNYYKIPTEELTAEDRFFGPQSGYYAISAHYLIRLRTIPTAFGYGIAWKEKKFEPIAVIGHTIYIFNFDTS